MGRPQKPKVGLRSFSRSSFYVSLAHQLGDFWLDEITGTLCSRRLGLRQPREGSQPVKAPVSAEELRRHLQGTCWTTVVAIPFITGYASGVEELGLAPAVWYGLVVSQAADEWKAMGSLTPLLVSAHRPGHRSPNRYTWMPLLPSSVLHSCWLIFFQGNLSRLFSHHFPHNLSICFYKPKITPLWIKYVNSILCQEQKVEFKLHQTYFMDFFFLTQGTQVCCPC